FVTSASSSRVCVIDRSMWRSTARMRDRLGSRRHPFGEGFAGRPDPAVATENLEGDNDPEARGEEPMERARFGRQAELARISSFLDALPTGPEALILGGDAGIGKSALWLDAQEQARSRSYRALSSRPTESEAKLSFAALG